MTETYEVPDDDNEDTDDEFLQECDEIMRDDDIVTGARLLERAGQWLYGENWKGSFSHTFGVTTRRLRRMVAGTETVPVGLLMDVETELRDQGNALDTLLMSFEAIPRPEQNKDGDGI